MHRFTGEIVALVVSDIEQEFTAPPAAREPVDDSAALPDGAYADLLDARMLRLERSMGSVLALLKNVVRQSDGAKLQRDNQP